MILLWGLERDTPVAAVRAALERSGAPVAFVDQREVLQSEIELSSDTGVVGGSLRIADRVIELGSVTAAYLRPYDSRRLPHIARAGESSREWRHVLFFDELLWSWAEVTPALVVNRGSAMAHNNSKPYQSAQIRSFGFEIPDTLLTTDPEAVREFWSRHGTVVYKSVSAVRSVVSRLGPEKTDHLDRVVWCPTQFQQYVPGADYRVHVVGEKLFCCKIVSEADDYRYALRQGAAVNKVAVDLPRSWADRCRALAASQGLAVAGMDLRCTPDGAWYCFEVNPSPAFTYYDSSEQSIAGAVARLLVRAGAA